MWEVFSLEIISTKFPSPQGHCTCRGQLGGERLRFSGFVRIVQSHTRNVNIVLTRFHKTVGRDGYFEIIPIPYSAVLQKLYHHLHPHTLTHRSP